MVKRPFAGAPLIFALFLGACAGPQKSPDASGPSAATEDAAIASALKQVQTTKVEYKISPTDLVNLTVFQQPDFDRTMRITQNGTISLPLLGTLKIGGLSVTEAEALLSEKLKEYVKNPQVTLFIKEYSNKKIFILGEVKTPGSYELPAESKLTVLEAVTMAGGFTPIAAPDRTKVIRTVEGKNQSFTIEVSAITKRGEKQKDIQLEPNDVVFVPQSFF